MSFVFFLKCVSKNDLSFLKKNMIDWKKNMQKLYKHTIEQFPCNSFICVKKTLLAVKHLNGSIVLIKCGSYLSQHIFLKPPQH